MRIGPFIITTAKSHQQELDEATCSRTRRYKFWDETLTDAHAVHDGSGKRIKGIGKWIERGISTRIKEGYKGMVVELWVREPKPATIKVNRWA